MSSEPGTEEKKNLHIQRLIQEKEEYLKKIEEEKSLQVSDFIIFIIKVHPYV